MNKKILVIAAVIVAAILGGTLFLLSNDEAEQASTQMQAQETTTEPVMTDAEPQMTQPTAAPGTYVDYSAVTFADTPGTKVLFFHAPWCPQCRDLDADIKRNVMPSGVTIFKVDYDSNQALRQKYGVTIQTTLVKVDGNGQLVESYVAYDDPSLQSVINNLL